MTIIQYFTYLTQLRNETALVNTIRVCGWGKKDVTFSGKQITHKDGTVTITRAKKINQYFLLN